MPVERLISADQARAGRAGRREDEPVHRVAHTREGAEFHRLFDIQSQHGIAGVTGQGLQDLYRPESQAPLFVEQRNLDESYRWNVTESLAAIRRSKSPSRGATQPRLVRQVPDDRMRVGDERHVARRARWLNESDSARRAARNAARSGTRAAWSTSASVRVPDRWDRLPGASSARSTSRSTCCERERPSR